MFVGHMCVIVLLLTLSGSFARGKASALVEKYVRTQGGNQTDEEELRLFLKRWLFWLAVCDCPMALGALLELDWLYIAGIAVFLAAVVVGVIYVGVRSRSRKPSGE